MDSVAPQAHGRFVVDDHGVAVTPATMDACVVVRSTIIAALALATAACATPAALDTAQAPLCSQRVQTRLFFGLEAPDGRVPDTAWQAFVDEAVTPRFGEGLTAGGLLAGGQSEVILRVAAGSNIGPVIEQEVARAANARARPLQAALQSVRLVESIRPFESEAQRAAAFERALESAAAGAAGPARVEFTAVGAGETFDASAQASAGNLITWVFIPLLGASGLFVSERLLGTLQRQLTTPTRRSTYLAGSIGSQFLIALAQMIILILFGIYVMKVPWGNSPAALMVVLVAFGLAGVALGTALGTFVKSESQATNLSILFGMAMALLGGCWFPMELFPAWLQQAAKILPTTWAMTAMTDLTMRGGGMADILPESAVLLGFAVVFFVIGVRRFRYD